jgi:two-component system cell cycle response regulator DivK
LHTCHPIRVRVDLILLDIQLPNEDGYGVLGQLRLHPKLKDTRVVAVTANILPQDEAKARTAGFDGFIGKPLDFNRFPQQITALLAGEDVWAAR